MKKFLSVFLSICLVYITIIPAADASLRIRKWRLNQSNNTQNFNYQSYQTYNHPQVYQNSGNTYYFSPNYISGYTYYSYPTPWYYLYNINPPDTPIIGEWKYYFSPIFVQGYTYYSTPVPGYYYYFPTTIVNNYENSMDYNHSLVHNRWMICVNINGNYQCNNNSYRPLYSTYPGCSSPDIIIGGQIWASCNALNRNGGSSSKSGWFFAWDIKSSFISYNGINTTLEWIGKQTWEKSWNIGPCANGYRLPTRGEWETLRSYARANWSSVASLISLPQNGAYQWYRNTNGDIVVSGRLPVDAAYWASSQIGERSMVMHIGSSYAGYNTSGTDYGYAYTGYQWTYTDTGLQLIESTTGELANVRCIR